MQRYNWGDAFALSATLRRPRGRYRSDRAKDKTVVKIGVPWLELFKLVMPIVAVLVAFVLGGRAQQDKDRREGRASARGDSGHVESASRE